MLQFMYMEMTENEKVIAKYNELLAYLPPFIEDYVDSLASVGKGSKTILGYTRDLKIFFDWLHTLDKYKNIDFSSVSVKDLLESVTVKELDRFKLFLVNGNPDKVRTSAALISRKLAAIRSMYKYFYNTEEIKINITDKVENPKGQKKDISVLQLSEVDSMYEAVDLKPEKGKAKEGFDKTNLRDKAIITLFFGTGLRVSELVSINLTDINYLTAEIKVKRKGGDICTVNFNGDVEEAIKDYIENARPSLLNGNESDALFISINHQRITVRSVEKLIKKYAIKAGIGDKVTPHELRRTYGNTLYRATGDIYLTAAALNHKNIQTTIAHYVPHNTDKLKEISQDNTLTNNHK